MLAMSLIIITINHWLNLLEAVALKSSVKKVFLEISQNSQENICARDSFNKVAGPAMSTYQASHIAS